MKSKDEIEDLIVRSRVRMLTSAMPFFGMLAVRLQLVNGSGWISTAATDGKHLYYNEDFVKSLTKPELDFLVAHEVMHCVYEHSDRIGSRDPDVWNAACDYVINGELVEAGVGKMPSVGLHDRKYDGMTSEQVYDLLMEEIEKNGKENTNLQTLDEHLDDANEGDGNGSGEGEGGDGNFDPTGFNGQIPMDEEERRRLKDEMQQAVMDAARSTGAGNLPAGIKRLVKDLTEPQMDWREILNVQIQSTIKNDYTFSRPAKKSWSSGCYLPGQLNDFKLEVAIAIDTSGSISEKMLRDFLSEIKGIMEQFAEFKINLWTFDTAVYNEQEFTSENLEDITEYNIHGGGGTEFMVNWKYMKDNDIEPHMFIMFTDGYPFGEWGDPYYTDTYFLIHGNKSIVAPFGMTLYYEEDN